MSGWYITVKDLLVLTRDKQALVLLLVLPLVLISVIGISTGQFLTRDDNVERVKIVVVDQNEGSVSLSFVAGLRQMPEFLITSVSSMDAAFDALRSGEASLILLIGPKFQELVDEIRMRDIFDMTDGLPVTGLASLDLTVKTRSNSGAIGNLMEAGMFSQVIKFIVPIAARKNPVARNWLRSREDADATDGISKGLPSVPNLRAKGNLVSQWVVPGFTVMFAYFLISIMARSFMVERDQGTMQRLLTAPVGTLPLLIGKTFPFYLTSALQCSLLFLCGILLFGMPWGSQPAYLIPVILCTSASAASLGLVLSTMVHTDQQISSYGTTLILVLSALSGCFLPRELCPKMMKQISLFTPHGWSLKAFDAVLNHQQIDPKQIATYCGMLLVFTAVCFTAGWWRFHHASEN
jgi:ABC-2 type transport system permease protein